MYAVHMDSNRQPETEDLLYADIDLRLMWLWTEAWEVEQWTTDRLARFLRAAYGFGYLDALKEEQRGQLCLDHGLRLPARGEA